MATATASPQRIVSFLPSATEMIYALGLGDRLVGVTHECDYPEEARSKPVVIRPALPLEGLSPREIDERVSARLHDGKSLYQADEALLRRLSPDLIVAQNLCQVCAPSGNEMTQVVRALPHAPKVLWQTPHNLEEVLENFQELGDATGRSEEARAIVADARERIARVRKGVRGLPPPRVFMMEWIDPVFCAGHWVPEMVEIAGGHDGLARPGEFSFRVPWKDVIRWAPQVLVLSPCSVPLQEAIGQWELLRKMPGTQDLPAVREGRTFVVDSGAYFSRPGPRLTLGIELLAHLFHPDQFAWKGPRGAFVRLPTSREGASSATRRMDTRA
ncbi:MAG: cobalamin-binding protein [Euryarchaeota archaeon]|nr:cobalamin-binding protein [Euryarchaeota archaeon]MDE2046608.1 cobalamin-binding protein [Thermoplasmata archaeon]